MPFSHNSRNFQLQGGVLHALCERSSTSGYLASKIDLNRFIGNYGGDFQFGHGDFLSTSAHVHLDGTILSGDLPDWKGVFGKSYIDLDQCIDNIDGVLTMANPSSPEEPRSSLVNRSQAWKDKIPSVNFQLFNCGDDNAIPDSYMVKLKRDSNMTKHIERLQKQMPPSFVDSKPSFELKFQSKLLNEYAANFTGEGLLRVATSSDVEIISSETKGWGAVVTSNASWGLQAISQRVPLPANSDPFSQTYEFDTVIDPGSPGVDVYIIDSGINADEASLVDRAVHRVAVHNGVIFDGPEDDIYDEPQIHGTAIASIIAEIAPTARIISIKTLRPQGGGVWAAEGDDLQALEWVYHFTQTFRRPSIVNFCITHPRPIPTEMTPISRAVQFLVDAGIPVCAAAGNSSEDAGNYAPGHLDDVITVAASDIQNQLCQFSNWGGSVSIVAPGEAIWAAGDYRSGTSFATPHVTGVASNILAANPQLGAQPPMTAQALRIELLSRGTPDVLNPIPLPNNTVNLLLHQ